MCGRAVLTQRLSHTHVLVSHIILGTRRAAFGSDLGLWHGRKRSGPKAIQQIQVVKLVQFLLGITIANLDIIIYSVIWPYLK